MTLRILSILWIAIFLPTTSADEMPTARVGQALVIEEIHIPGGQIQAVPRRDRTPPLVVRILDVRPAKDGFRYDFEVQGLDPGTHDLAQYLEPASASEPATIPELKIQIITALPEGPPKPHNLPSSEIPKLGGYRTMLLVIGGIWLVGLIAILCWRRKSTKEAIEEKAPPTLAERLRPLVASASAGNLSPEDRASLDRLLIAHWRRKLPEINDLPPAQALATLRKHPESSPLLLALEKWIHSPAQTEPEDIAKLLAPYSSTDH